MPRPANFVLPVLLILTGVLILVFMLIEPPPSPPLQIQVTVQDINTVQPLPQTTVRLVLPGLLPLTTVTDEFGLAVFSVELSDEDRIGQLSIHKSQYSPYRENINIRQTDIPHTVQLRPTN